MIRIEGIEDAGTLAATATCLPSARVRRIGALVNSAAPGWSGRPNCLAQRTWPSQVERGDGIRHRRSDLGQRAAGPHVKHVTLGTSMVGAADTAPPAGPKCGAPAAGETASARRLRERLPGRGRSSCREPRRCLETCSRHTDVSAALGSLEETPTYRRCWYSVGAPRSAPADANRLASSRAECPFARRKRKPRRCRRRTGLRSATSRCRGAPSRLCLSCWISWSLAALAQGAEALAMRIRRRERRAAPASKVQ